MFYLFVYRLYVFLDMLPRSVVLVSAARTPIGSFLGSLSSIPATDLGSHAIRSALNVSGMSAGDIQLGVGGQVLSSGCGQAPFRQAMLGANILADTYGVNKVCSSGMKAISLCASSIAIGEVETGVAFGMESMSNVPHIYRGSRLGARLGPITLDDSVITDGLWDVYNKIHMGTCAEKTCLEHKVSRSDQDEYAIESYKRANEAWSSGRMSVEVYPIGDANIDEEIGKLRIEKLATLRPAFLRENGTITAANASKLNDGASAIIMCSEEYSREFGLKPIARIISFADFAHDPIDFSTAPRGAIEIALKRANLTVKDIDYWEFNEAFSVVPIVNANLLGIDLSRVNVDGGAVALGHPIGASGNRIVATLARILQQRDASIGCAAICNGGGGSTSIIIERM